MPTVASLMERLSKQYKPDEYIAVAIWCEEDVLGCAKERGMKITREQAQSILDQMESNHDAEIGITWDTIYSALDELPYEEDEDSEDDSEQ